MIKKLLLTAGLLVSLSTYAQTMATIETNVGNIQLQLEDKKAPVTVENFIQYAKSGFYNETVFHRVIDGFMIQGGGFTPDMAQKNPKKPIKNEAQNGLKNQIGTIAMARTMDPHSATSQFFINVANNDNLNYRDTSMQGAGYAVFGRVTSGMDIVNKIAKVPTRNQGMHQNVPVKPIVIKRITIQN